MNSTKPQNGGILESLGLHRKELRAWAIYDVASSAFICTVAVAVLPIYFSDNIAKGMEPQKVTSLWGYISTLATLLSVLIAPVLGVIADAGGKKKRFLAMFAGLGASCSILLSLGDQGQVILGIENGKIILTSFLYVIASLSFASGEVFYASILPHVAKPDEVHRTSSSGFALGYLGGGILLAINLAWISKPELFGFSGANAAVKASFISVGIWWIAFLIPLLKSVDEPKPEAHVDLAPKNFTAQLKKSVTQIIGTFREVRKYPHAFFFLLGFWFYSDGVVTIIKMAAVFGKEVGIANESMIAAILMIQFLGVPFTFAFGPIANRFGAKNSLYFTIIVYLGLTFSAYFMETTLHFWTLAVGIAIVQGGCQALSRSIYSLLIPPERSSEFFSFFAVSGKFAGIFGTLMFALIGDLTGSTRSGLLFLTALFVIGIICVRYVDIEQGKLDAQKA